MLVCIPILFLILLFLLLAVQHGTTLDILDHILVAHIGIGVLVNSQIHLL